MSLSAVRSDRGAQVFVWGVWLVMMLIALMTLAKHTRNIPLAEDWLFVAPLTGNEPDLTKWLWIQNNEHRVPLPRLILLLLLKATAGDFRAGMILSIITLGALSFAMIRIARALRGGKTSFADAFFPVSLLHLGNWENLFWSWQFCFVLSTALACIVLLVLVSRQTIKTPGTAALAGICLGLLPLCGATGLLFVPFLALWLGYCGVFCWRTVKTGGGRRLTSVLLTGWAAIALCLMGLYFVGYERPSWAPPNPGLIPSLKTAIKFQALGFGPVVERSWTLSAIVVMGVLLPTAAVAALGVLRHKGMERHRALGVFIFFGSAAVFALAMGWGRAGVIEAGGGWPLRYVLLAVPIFCAAFFVWELYGSPKLRMAWQMSLMVGLCILLPFNMVIGFEWGEWYMRGMNALEQDLLAGNPPSRLAEKHRVFLIHWWDEGRLRDAMCMLHDADIGLFARMQTDAVSVDPTIPAEPVACP